MNASRKYEFNWELLGNLELGRPNLGSNTRLEVYRLMQSTFRDILEQRYGDQAADEVFYEAGRLAGQAFYQHIIQGAADANEFFRKFQAALKEFNIAVLRLEKVNLESGDLTLTMAEDLDCSGLPEVGYEVCTYDEGFIAAVLECYFDKPFQVKEVDCWCTGDRTCRFSARAISLQKP